MTANPADDPVLRLLQEAGLEDDAALAALLDELKATAAAEQPAPSHDVARLMSGRRPARTSWFARRGTRTTTVVLLAAALAGGASAAAAANPAFHAVVGDAISSLAKLVGPAAHPTPAAPAPGHDEAKEATPSPQHGDDHRGSVPGSTSGEAGDAQGTPAPRRPSTAAQELAATEAQLGAGSQVGAGGAGAPGDDPGRSGGASTGSGLVAGGGQGAGGGRGDDQGASGASSTQKQAPAHHEPAPTPSPQPPAAGSQTSQPGGGGSAGSDR